MSSSMMCYNAIKWHFIQCTTLWWHIVQLLALHRNTTCLHLHATHNSLYYKVVAWTRHIENICFLCALVLSLYVDQLSLTEIVWTISLKNYCFHSGEKDNCKAHRNNRSHCQCILLQTDDSTKLHFSFRKSKTNKTAYKNVYRIRLGNIQLKPDAQLKSQPPKQLIWGHRSSIHNQKKGL